MRHVSPAKDRHPGGTRGQESYPRHNEVGIPQGRIEEGLSCMQQALTAFESTGMRVFHSISIMQLGEAYLLADQVEDPRACVSRAVTLAQDCGERGYEALALRLLGEIASHHQRPDVATAEARYGAAMALADELGMRPLKAHWHLGFGKLYRRVGDRARTKSPA